MFKENCLVYSPSLQKKADDQDCDLAIPCGS